MKKHKFSLRRLFSNNKFLIAFSIVVAIIFWIVVALEYAPIVENEIKDVPVKIEMENSVPDKLGLQVFSQTEYTVDISVKGNRYVVGGNLLTANDFEVVAQTAYVNAAGNHTLKLKVTPKEADADFEILGMSSEYIEVYFDKYEEKEFEVIPRINTDLENLTADDCIFNKDDIILNDRTVTLSGAKTQIDSIKAVYADIKVDKTLDESLTYDAPINIFADDSGTNYVKINGEENYTIPVTLPVYKVVNLPTSVAFKNAPADYVNNPIGYTCSPSSVKAAVLMNGGDMPETIEIGTIDFSDISTDNYEFTFDTNIENVKILDSTTQFTVRVNVANLTQKVLTLKQENVTVTGVKDADSVTLTSSSPWAVTVVGPKSDLDALTDNSVSAQINAAEIDLKSVDLKSGSHKVTMTVYLKNSTSCWAAGTYYATLTVK
ncbi:MAG: hypothetical protein PUB20_00720 [Clostridia bacterium]|nr:hypothetical protein [Clostridia bacterium]